MSEKCRRVIRAHALAVVTGIAAAIDAGPGGVAQAAIIGDDNLMEWLDIPDSRVRDASRATAVLIKKSRNWVRPRGDEGWDLAPEVPVFGDADSICAGERFVEQAAPGDCSGFLAGPDVVVTANHCVRSFGGCAEMLVAFDFVVDGQDHRRFQFGEDSIFSCAQVVASDEGQDWALIRLDRVTRGRVPLRFASDASARGLPGTPVSVWGYPRGLPLKLADGAIVSEPSGLIDPEWKDDFFEADLDVFGGTSGAPVVNGITGEVEGILCTGFGEFEDWENDPATGRECRRLRRMGRDEATLPWISRARGIQQQIEKFIQKRGVLPGA